MLIVLNGVDTINKKFFAKEIAEALNSFTLDGYLVDTKLTPWALRDPETNELVLHIGTDNPVTTLIVNSLNTEEVVDSNTIPMNAGIVLLQKLQKLEIDFFNTFELNHYKNFFVDQAYDFQLGDATIDSVEKQNPAELAVANSDGTHTVINDGKRNYSNLIADYNKRQFDTVAITGAFSKIFIDKITSDLGEDNVIVINIIRNPSSAFLLTQQTDQYYLDHTYYTKENDNQRLITSLVTAASIKNYKNVITIKFEDIIKDGTFYIGDTEVPVPPGYESFNSFVTKWENDNILSLNLVKEESLNEFNNFMSNWATNTISIDNPNLPIPAEKIMSFDFSKFPNNIFEDLDYSPLTSSQIKSSLD